MATARNAPDNLKECPRIPEIVPAEGWDTVSSISSLIFTPVEGPAISLWSTGRPEEREDGALKLQVQPDQPLVIGRQEGGENDYLDPRYRPTQIIPNSGRRVVGLRTPWVDSFVSRGHFTIRSSPLGIILVNGVPRRGGGIRPPINGTELLAPVCRRLDAAEELLIERNSSATIRLPNGSVIRIDSE